MATEAARDGDLSPLLGEVLDGKYRLERVLGRGGMGVVYQATHLGTRRTVALKVVAPRFLADAEFVERFRREAEAAGRLRHPNVVDVTDFGFGEIAGRRLAYLVMEYLDGCSLEDVLRQEGRLPLRWTADIMDQACAAVAEAHRRGIVHRDLKPSNLWLEPDRRGSYTVKVLDFGLAKLTAAPAREAAVQPIAAVFREPAEGDTDSPTRTGGFPGRGGDTPTAAVLALPAVEEGETRVRVAAASTTPDLTSVGAVLGTPLYMSPEQCRGESVGAPSDVYSLGVIAYRMLSGQAPFTGTESRVIEQHLAAQPPPFAGSTVPKPVAALVMSALAKDPAARPASAAAFGAAFVARAERSAWLLRQTLTLFMTEPLTFLGIAAAGLAPVVMLAAIAAWASPDTLEPGVAVRPASITAGVGLGMLQILALATGLLSASAVCQPIVAQLLAMPLRPLSIGPLLRAFRRRLVSCARLAGSFFLEYVVMVVSGTPLILLLRAPRAWPGAPPWPILLLPVWSCVWAIWLMRAQDSYSFAGGAILMEGLEGRAARERSRVLARLAKRDLPGFVGIRGAILLLALSSVGVAVHVMQGTPSFLSAAILVLAMLALAVLGVALILIAVALLYFKARQATGEPLAQALEQFEKEALPAGYWQQQVRDRIRLQVESSR